MKKNDILKLRLIRLPEVLNLTGLKRSTLYQMMDENEFPNSVTLNERAVAWVESEIQEWILQKVNSSRQKHQVSHVE